MTAHRINSYRIVAVTWMTLLHATVAFAQSPTVLDPATAGAAPNLLNSPEVGYLQGIQQFGHRMRTDPDSGSGLNYRVFPTVTPRQGMNQEDFLWAFVHLPEAFQLKAEYNRLASRMLDRETARAQGASPERLAELDALIRTSQAEIARLQLGLKLALGGDESKEYFNRYATGRDTTANMRNLFAPETRSTLPVRTENLPPGLTGPPLSGLADFGTLAAGAGTGSSGNLTTSTAFPETTLFHQPLIQIKVRLVEASRLNSSDYRSVLDYISRQGNALTSQITANNINGNRESTRAATRLPNAAGVVAEQTTGMMAGTLAGIADGGQGALINLTTEHVNFLTNMLVTEFNGDVFTVPEVVTLNGQNVEFVAGDKRPFPLGLVLQQGSGTTTQEFFYKHVGTILSVTPRIVNWGRHLEGSGQAPIVDQEVQNWPRLARWMGNPSNLRITEAGLQSRLVQLGQSNSLVPRTVKVAMLNELEKYSPKLLRQKFRDLDTAQSTPLIRRLSAQADEQATELSVQPAGPQEVVPIPETGPVAIPAGELPILRLPSGYACDWKPEDCTIDLEIMVRRSNVNVDTLTAQPAEDENAIANVVQVKSGHGVVMGGMIATSETLTVSKIPLLGDLPVVGYAFRSKSTDRAKNELIILVEATVLPCGQEKRHETAKDFRLGYDYVSGELRANPLEYGMHSAGFGQYLPPACADECDFWQEHGNRMRRVTTEIDDIFH